MRDIEDLELLDILKRGVTVVHSCCTYRGEVENIVRRRLQQAGVEDVDACIRRSPAVRWDGWLLLPGSRA